MAPAPDRRTLSEHESKTLLAGYGVPLARESLAATPDQAARAAEAIGFPVVLKLCGDAIAHKTERDLVRLGLADSAAVRAAAGELLAKARPEDGTVSLLVAEGLTNGAVAKRLYISPHTVNTHLRHVFSKLGVSNRVELAAEVNRSIE